MIFGYEIVLNFFVWFLLVYSIAIHRKLWRNFALRKQEESEAVVAKREILPANGEDFQDQPFTRHTAKKKLKSIRGNPDGRAKKLFDHDL